MKSNDTDILVRIEEQLALLHKKVDALSNVSQKSGERKYPSKRGFGDREKASFQTVCAECGQDCDVPFKPLGNRPVFCSECFAKQQGEDGGRPKFHKKRDRDFKKPFGKKPFHKKFGAH